MWTVWERGGDWDTVASGVNTWHGAIYLSSRTTGLPPGLEYIRIASEVLSHCLVKVLKLWGSDNAVRQKQYGKNVSSMFFQGC